MFQELDPGWYKWGDLRVEAADRKRCAEHDGRVAFEEGAEVGGARACWSAEEA